MKELIDVLYLIKENPDEYIGKRSLERLYCFIHGYVKCQYIKDCTTPIWLEKFMIYLQEKYSEKRCIEVPSIIRQITLSDEEAFDKYYELLEDFFQNV
ncbi:hypothetical protein [Clostridium sp. AN503]|uniref:hypothetical protein n=1 Tax=Clostridium sp. AN503 TaxID=3160598 RepID=UPI00345AB86A